ncbi:hypothetical protein CEUSTIGMA_g7705.t1 [Chlamydomonas eustigma]|uniref:Uncharacterized protein n=1 Tax=Chlamydomonas eustigma TaxID=1157962 RepID=A0A250XB08_9CHLO|nr:hypothetical protein CEUSTIGMA_g7705.t1 [Chlamydomonas eustigma]|eukprot:GAX80267.1 hypothetical protein CEUSTIGMA_g7705.t1 [Chlamydomonas eustigma]
MPNSNIWKYAAQGDLASLQRAVKEGGEDVDIQNKLGESAVHLASRGGHASLLLLLGKFGADFTLTDGGGRTPAHHAAAAGQLDCLRALAGPLGARLDIKDSGGRRPLDIAKGDGVRKFISNWMSEAASGRSGGGGSGASGTAVKAAHSSQLGKQAAAAGRVGRLANDYHSYQDVEQQRLALRATGSIHHHQQAAAAAGGGSVHNEMNSRGGRGSEQEEEVPMKASPSLTPLSWQPLYKAGTTRMPRCTQEEVGFTPQGLTLGMPKRPSWRGVVRSAPELHALEEQAFASWQHSLQQRPDAASISFYEPRLEYWRQLWRVLELSDVVITIVDARNPLLHFSHALTLHIIEDQKAAPLLVLNKCDLIPMEAVQEWKSYFEQRYPGLTVVAASTRGDITTAAGGGCSAAMISSGGIGGGGSRQSAAGRTGAGGSVDRGAAAAIIKAVLECRLRLKRGDPAWVQDLKVSDVVGEDFDAILTEARARSKYSKRDSDVVPSASDLMVAFKRNVGQGMTGKLQSQQQQQQQQGQRSSRVTVPAGGSSSVSSLNKQQGDCHPSGISSEGNKQPSSLKGLRSGLPPQHVSSQHPEGSSDVDEDEDYSTGGGATEQQWGVKGTKAGRKLALKKKRAARRSQQQQLPSGPSTLQADEDGHYGWVDLGQDKLKGARKGMGSIDSGNDMKQDQTCSSGHRVFSADKGRAAFVDEVKKREKGGAASAHAFQAKKGTAMKRDAEDHTSVEDVMSTAEDSVMESEDGDHHHKWKDDADSLVSGADEDDDELKRQEEEEFEVVGWSGGPPQLDRKEGQEGVTTGATGGIDNVGMDGLGAGGAHGGEDQEEWCQNL